MKHISINGTTVLVNMDKVCAIAENYIQFDGGHVIWGEVDKTQFQHTNHGHWIEVQRIHEKDHTAICECSLCGDTVWVYDGQRAWNYCPNCGARMDEVEDGTN